MAWLFVGVVSHGETGQRDKSWRNYYYPHNTIVCGINSGIIYHMRVFYSQFHECYVAQVYKAGEIITGRGNTFMEAISKCLNQLNHE